MNPGRRHLFGSFRLEDGVLFRDVQRVALTPKAVEILQVLLDAHGRIVSKDELMQKVWPGTFVDESSLTSNISLLRKTLGADPQGRAYIENIPKRGYRFLAPLQPLQPRSAPSIELAAPRPWRRGFLLAGSVGLVVILFIASFFTWQHLTSRHREPPKRIMVAVLPVQNLTGDSAKEYITDGLTEEIIAQLSRFNPDRLGVIARTSSMAYKTTGKTARQIGSELGIDYLVETSMRQSGNQVRITSQLVRTRDQTHLWSVNYHRTQQDLFSLQDELARAIALHVKVELSQASHARLAGASSLNPDAHLAFLEGRYYWNQRSPWALERAILSFQKAIQLDPDYALAYSGLADAYSSQCLIADVSPAKVFPQAKAAAMRALELDDDLAEAHTSLAYVHFWYDWDWPAAESEFKRALELNQGYATAHQWYAEYLRLMGREEEAIAENQRALELDPLSIIINMEAGLPYYLQRRYDAAIPHFQKALELQPSFSLAHCVLGWAYQGRGDHQRAVAELEKAAQLNDSSAILSSLGSAYAAAGRRHDAEQILRQLQERAAKQYVSPFFLSTLYIDLNDSERALDYLEQAYRNHDWVIVWIFASIRFDPVRPNPRFTTLLSKLNFPVSPTRHN